MQNGKEEENIKKKGVRSTEGTEGRGGSRGTEVYEVEDRSKQAIS